jgi:hypothetical protein
VSVNAEAEAHRTQVEGTAEAQIVLSKGEAEAKALALRAEAYKQFNEAAVIQTVLGMLPDIVRAAAEPMANIDTLTVLSNDGASEMVKTATRTVAEASAAVKGLTGLDVPGLIGGAMAARGTSDGAPAPAPDEGSGGSKPATRRGRGSQARTTSKQAATTSAAQRMPATADAVAEDVEARLRRATSAAAAPLQTRLDEAEAAAENLANQIPAGAVGSELEDAVATALRRVPGIDRYREARIDELATRGPRIARAVWATVAPRLSEDQKALTIGDLLDRAGQAR